MPPKALPEWPHNALRHTHASIVIALGKPLESLTFEFGHSGGVQVLKSTPDPEIHQLPAGADARDLVESILGRWKKSGLCDPSDVLILHAQSDIAKSPLGDRRILAGHNLRECTEQEDAPNTIRHTSIHKAKGLDSKAVILIGLPPHGNLASDYDHFSWFMAASRARQLLAIVERV